MPKYKLKSKGKRYYRSANSSVHRVPPSRRLTRLNRRMKALRRLDKKLSL